MAKKAAMYWDEASQLWRSTRTSRTYTAEQYAKAQQWGRKAAQAQREIARLARELEEQQAIEEALRTPEEKARIEANNRAACESFQAHVRSLITSDEQEGRCVSPLRLLLKNTPQGGQHG